MRIAVAFVTIPIYLHHVGEARYGVISIVWVLLGLFGFLDLGLSRAVTNALAKLRTAPQAHRARVLLTTFALNLGIGLIGGLVLYIFGGLLLRYFISVPDALGPRDISVASLDRLSSTAYAYFRRRRGRAGEPRTLPAREFNTDLSQ
jgi:O-antigen/teichoic acid export membrane protein